LPLTFFGMKASIPFRIRRVSAADLPSIGSILYEAFNQVFARHGYPPPVPTREAGETLVSAYHDYDPSACFVAVRDDRLVGSAFFHRRGRRAGVGPVTVDPACQGEGIGRLLMERVIEELSDCSSIRLFQDAFNQQSFSLYVRLGFQVKDVMAVLRAEPGPASFAVPPGIPGIIRPMTVGDVPTVAARDTELTGLERSRDLDYLRERGPGFVLEGADGAIRGYSASFRIGDNLFLGPAAAPDAGGLYALLDATFRFMKPRVVTVRVAARPGEVMASLLESGFRVRSIGTYMVRGEYDEPSGVSLSALFPETL
jgi:GNAT superfamily N-acetyltransferase